MAAQEAPARAGAITIREGEFRLFQRFMLERAGITLAPSKKALVSGRLAKRLKTCGCASFAAYFELLQRDPEERQCALDLLTTNETYFFREPRHFDFLRDGLLRQLPADRPFRAWSAACSSGEEVYSLAMVLADSPVSDWSVLGSDLNTQVLEKARSGHYGLTRTEGIPRELLHRYCLKGKGRQAGTFLIGRELRSRVDFRQINLNAALPPVGPFDVIFLRNVMIYFSAATKGEVVRRVLGALNPGGMFFIGHSESLNGIVNGLELVRPSVYRKPL